MAAAGGGLMDVNTDPTDPRQRAPGVAGQGGTLGLTGLMCPSPGRGGGGYSVY